MKNEELETDTELFFDLSEAFGDMYGYLKEIYEIHLGISCEGYTKKQLRNFLENTRENADMIYEKWAEITTDRINKCISDNNPTLPIRRYTEWGTYKNLPTLPNDMMAAQNLAAQEETTNE